MYNAIASVSSYRSDPLPFLWNTLFVCLWGWSFAIVRLNLRQDLWTMKFPLRYSSHAAGCFTTSSTMSLLWIGTYIFVTKMSLNATLSHTIHFKNIKITPEMDSPYSKSLESGVIHGCTTFGSQVMTVAYSGRLPFWICPIWPPQLEPSLAPSINWRVMIISTPGPKLVLVERFEQLWCF